MDVSPASINGSEEVKNHVLICGIHDDIYYFILPLRANYIKEY